MSDAAGARLEAVESLLTHLQHELAQMHAVLLAHTAELDALRKRCEKLEAGLEHAGDDPEPADPRAHVPPHWGGGAGRRSTNPASGGASAPRAIGMTNDECWMTKRDEVRSGSSFVIRHSASVIRHSSFVIRPAREISVRRVCPRPASR